MAEKAMDKATLGIDTSTTVSWWGIHERRRTHVPASAWFLQGRGRRNVQLAMGSTAAKAVAGALLEHMGGHDEKDFLHS